MSSNNLFDVFHAYTDGQVQSKVAACLTYEQALSYCKHSGAAIENLAIRRSEPSGAWVIPEDESKVSVQHDRKRSCVTCWGNYMQTPVDPPHDYTDQDLRDAEEQYK